jgi:hypothetical protein
MFMFMFLYFINLGNKDNYNIFMMLYMICFLFSRTCYLFHNFTFSFSNSNHVLCKVNNKI